VELQIQGLSKVYKNGVRALDNVSLTIPVGMYGLLGPNGAGKSTLMRTIATLQEPDSGEIHLGTLNVLRQKQELRKTLGYLPRGLACTCGPRRRNTCSRTCFMTLRYSPIEQ
jgi:ABC-type multidrug transport system ATPase subunit